MGTVTVTAAQGGGTFNGMELTVLVLTGAAAAASQPGSAASAQGVVSVPLTTTAVGSLVVGAYANGNGGTSAALGTTANVTDHDDASNGAEYCTFTAASLTGTPGTAAYGESSSTGAANSPVICAAEILPDGVIAQDASAPATAVTEAATSVTTAPFSPPAGSLLVALVPTDSADSTVTVSVTSTPALSWYQLVFRDGSAYMGAGAWAADVPGGPPPSPPGPAAPSPAWRQRFQRTARLPVPLAPALPGTLPVSDGDAGGPCRDDARVFPQPAILVLPAGG